METDRYQTIAAPVEDIILKEKGSRFIGYAWPVADEVAIKEHLASIKLLHPKATHHCYAFRLGLNGETYRANDDGEPSGSAGLPIYNQLLAHHLTQILVVVVRYYGGVKLGVAGLVKAYKETARETLDTANIITKELEAVLKLEFDFSRQNQIFTALNKISAQIKTFDAAERCSIEAVIKAADAKKIPDILSGMYDVSFEVL